MLSFVQQNLIPNMRRMSTAHFNAMCMFFSEGGGCDDGRENTTEMKSKTFLQQNLCDKLPVRVLLLRLTIGGFIIISNFMNAGIQKQSIECGLLAV